MARGHVVPSGWAMSRSEDQLCLGQWRPPSPPERGSAEVTDGAKDGLTQTLLSMLSQPSEPC